MSVLLAGGGIRGGQIYGSTNRLGEVPQDKPLVPHDLLATIYHALGVPLNAPQNNSGILRKTTRTTTAFGSANGGINFTNSGIVDLQAGTLAINAGYFPSAASQLKVVLAGTTPVTQFGRELFPGNAPLTGTLQVTLSNGFIPSNGNSFDIVGYAAHTGQFTATQLPPLPFGSTWKIEYNSAAVTLRVVPPQIITAPVILANGHFQMIYNGPAASAAIFQGSTNLIDWIPLMTNSPFNGSFLFDDSLASNYTNRFYQLLFVP